MLEEETHDLVNERERAGERRSCNRQIRRRRKENASKLELGLAGRVFDLRVSQQSRTS